MASKELPLTESRPMAGGDGPHSYFRHSSHQNSIVEAAMERMNKAIQEKMEFGNLTKTFHIADFGCSVGPNTFIAVENIIEQAELKYHAQHGNHPSLQFQVFFNDLTTNDFNTLFKNLPDQYSHKYFAAGVPGPFHGRLFPNSSLHFGHSFFALHWLSKVPKEFGDDKCPAWNKGSIICTGHDKEVVEAYSAQFKKDMNMFLNARAQELVIGGLMAIVITATPDEVPFFQSQAGMCYDLLGSCLMEMAKMGLTSEEKVEAFNLPIYHPHVKEFEALLKSNEYFSLEQIDGYTKDVPSAQLVASGIRAIMEELIREHFGNEIIDPVFECFAKELSANYDSADGKIQKPIYLCALLKRK